LDAEKPQAEPKECFNFSNITDREENMRVLPKALQASFEEVQAFEKVKVLFGRHHRLTLAYTQTCNMVGRRLLRLLAEHLSVEESEGGNDYFEEKHQLDQSKHSSSVVRMLHYKSPEGAQGQGGEEEEEVRCGCHSDYGSLTLLFQDGVGGLQVMKARTSADDPKVFINVHPISDCIVVNCADLLQFWTDSYCISAMHRVVAPRDAAGRRLFTERYSLTYFMHPKDETAISRINATTLRDAPWTATRTYEHRRMQLLAQQLPPKFTAIQYLLGRLTNTYSYFADSSWIKRLQLEPHPEGGYWKDMWSRYLYVSFPLSLLIPCSIVPNLSKQDLWLLAFTTC
jgi:isopenicillin N synthase-like dioxygenase